MTTRTAWRDPSLAVGVVMLGAVLLAALGADVLAPADPGALGVAGDRLQPPSGDHPFGTDALGRDVLSRLLHGARASLFAGVVGALGACLIGTIVGAAAGLGHRRLDRTLMSVTDLFLSFPRIFLALMLIALSAPSLGLVVGVIVATGWMGVARLVRAETLSLRERDFVTAARGLGLGAATVARRHILPHVLPLVTVWAMLRLGNAILLEAFLSYLGLGTQEPAVSWGAMIEHGRPFMVQAWWTVALPGLAIAWTTIGANLAGDALRDRLDPRHAERRDVA